MKQIPIHLLTWCFFMLILPGTSFSAIVHDDFSDVTTHGSVYFDLDKNGSDDLGVVWSYDSYADDTSAEASLPFGASNDNGFAASGALALKLGQGDAIGSTQDFRADTVMLSRYWDDYDWEYYTWGNWGNMDSNETAYLGFRFLDDDSAFHYGWIRAHVNPSNQYITLFDLAWETTAGKSVMAGDTGSAVPLPAAVWLLASGLFGLVGLNRKNRLE